MMILDTWKAWKRQYPPGAALSDVIQRVRELELPEAGWNEDIYQVLGHDNYAVADNMSDAVRDLIFFMFRVGPLVEGLPVV